MRDAIGALRETGHQVNGWSPPDACGGVGGVNDRAQLAEAETVLRRRINTQLDASGVTMIDPARTYIDSTVSSPRHSLAPWDDHRRENTIGTGSRGRARHAPRGYPGR